VLQNTKQLYGRKLGATDGEIGHVKDFYFDDQSWTIRYLVVDTGAWLLGRQVLLTPHAFGDHALGSHAFEITAAPDDVLHVKLTRKQIEDSPSPDSHRPISRQYEADYHRYFGWPTYWQGGGMLGLWGMAPILPTPIPEVRPHNGQNQRDDPHLRSTKATAGYGLHASDGKLGSVSGFMFEGSSWKIRELAVETGPWYAGKTVYVTTENISRISYDDSSVFINLSKADLTRTTSAAVAHVGSN
jgi:uncharacterized protein YrrD